MTIFMPNTIMENRIRHASGPVQLTTIPLQLYHKTFHLKYETEINQIEMYNISYWYKMHTKNMRKSL